MIAEFARERVVDNTIIVVFADSRYREVIDCWLDAIWKIHIENYIVISLDTELHAALSSRNVPCWLHENCSDLANLWLTRTKIVADLLHNGFDVIHSDADAMWISDPRPYLLNSVADVVFSQGTIWPERAYQRWGYVLCCGFYFIRSSHDTRELARNWIIQIEKDNDDQVAINHLLLENDIQWTVNSPYERVYDEHLFICSSTPITARISALNVTIAIVPHQLIPRIVMATDTPYVIHPLSEKNPEAVKQALNFSRHQLGISAS